MPLLAVLVTVAAAERKALKKRIRGTRIAWRDRLRAQIVLAAAMGRCTARIARDLRVSQDTVRKWRGRFADRGLEGLSDLPRPGRPRQISAEVRAAVVVLACQLPAATGVPLAHWTGPELAAELTAQSLASLPAPDTPVKPAAAAAFATRCGCPGAARTVGSRWRDV
jgi:transposase